MPEYWVEPYEPDDILRFTGRQVRLNKVPKQGSWFDLGDGTPAQAKVIRIQGGEPVIYARIGEETERRRLKGHQTD